MRVHARASAWAHPPVNVLVRTHLNSPSTQRALFSPDLSGPHCPAPPVSALTRVPPVCHVLFSSCCSLPLLTVSSYFIEDDVGINPAWGSENKGGLDTVFGSQQQICLWDFDYNLRTKVCPGRWLPEAHPQKQCPSGLPQWRVQG